MRRKVRWLNGGYHRHGWLHALVIMAAALMVPSAQAADTSQVEGTHGVLHLRGELTESACRLEMASAYQTVWLGNASTGLLAKTGDRGTPVNVLLHLRDCLPSPANSRDERSGNLVWSVQEPAVSVRFIAPADADNPQLVLVRGASGLALRITDAQGRDIRLGSRGAPQALAVGQNTLYYRVTPERTHAPLVPGAFAAMVDFQLSYD
ncbi:fimbrial protein [Serratia fonticola]|uniref:fimbrial protein n=1 Tax=Serratia fonticola TaxID=47917 RepID=UPI001376F3EB|nr:fimbrial protein [Serratia fonticola]MBC3218440.1 type 1 fimbrial protein [Serratia fonticola]NCG52762.1 type 1 fimbrial protein [Serratia fonticola]